MLDRTQNLLELSKYLFPIGSIHTGEGRSDWRIEADIWSLRKAYEARFRQKQAALAGYCEDFCVTRSASANASFPPDVL